jgi:hypothetical protein
MMTTKWLGGSSIVLLSVLQLNAVGLAQQASQGQTEPAARTPSGTGAADEAPPSPGPGVPWLQRERVLQLSDLGLDDATRKRSSRAELDLSFRARVDELLSGASLSLRFGRPLVPLRDLRRLELLLNGERVATLPRAQLESGEAAPTLALAPDLLAETNTLTLRLVSADGALPCALLPAGTWTIIRAGRLVLKSRKLPLANELSLLPLPFVDPKHDHRTTIDIAFAGPPTLQQIRAATSIAAYFGLHGAIKVAFRVHVGRLPKNNVIVLLDEPQQAARLGLTPATDAGVAFVPHPADRENLKALVLSATNPTDLQQVAAHLAIHARELDGAAATLSTLAALSTTPARPNVHWIREAGATSFTKVAAAKELVHRGIGDQTLALRFRLVPDLFVWPGDSVTINVRYQANYPATGRPPRIAFDFNQTFIASLPVPTAGAKQSARLRVPRELLRGYNEMRFHVSYRERDDDDTSAPLTCGAETPPVDASFVLSGQSTIELANLRRFRELPDLDLFLYDGYPFTRTAELGQTVAVLPSRPLPREIASLLSVVSHLAEVTGRAGSGLQLRSAADVLTESALDKDLLLVGVAQRHPLLQQWQKTSPLRAAGGRFALNESRSVLQLEQWLIGQDRTRERERIRDRLSDGAVSAVVGFRSPLHRKRSVVAVISPSPSLMPAMEQLQGYAESRHPNADVLLSTEEGRFLFRVGPAYAVGQVDPFTWIRWFLSQHWLLMLLSFFVAASLFAWVAQRYLRERAHQRLAGVG